MKFSYAWLQRYFDKKLPTPQKLAEALTFHAFEVDGIEKAGSDTLLDIKVLPDRAHDAFSHRGIAKEISAIESIPLARDSLAQLPALEPSTSRVKIALHDRTRSPRYVAALIEGVEVKPSPAWLQTLLISIGQRPINNVVDAANFVMFDMGQPLHAFDAGRLSSEKGVYKIGVRKAKAGEGIETLDGKAYVLTADDTLIVDAGNNAPIGIAGIKGGRAAEIGEKTRDIIIESANFNHVAVRKTAQRLKFRTDASVRFEHEISPELALYGAAEAAKLILELGGGELAGYADEYPQPQEPRPVEMTADDVSSKLGISLSDKEVEALLTRSGLPFEKNEGVFSVLPPSERLDLRITEDLVAEVGRLMGYERVEPVIPPPLEGSSGADINKRFYYAERIRGVFIRTGYSEVMTTSFAKKGEVCLVKSVASDKECLRGDLAENLGGALALNLRHADLLGLLDVRIFELGTVFRKSGEEYHLAWAVEGRKDKETFAESVFQALLDNVGISSSVCEGYVTRRDGVIELNIGAVIDQLPEPTTHSLAEPHERVSYRPFSPYPFVLRDIALFVPEGATIEETAALIRKHAGPLLAHSRLFDEFKKGDKVSYAFRLVFQSMEKTLTDAEVNAVMEKVGAALEEKGYEIR